MFTKVNGVSEILAMPIDQAKDIIRKFGGVRTIPGSLFSTKDQVAEFFRITPEALTAAMGSFCLSAGKCKRHILTFESYTELKRMVPDVEFMVSEDGRRQVCLDRNGVHRCEFIPKNGRFNLYSPNAILVIAALLHERKAYNEMAHNLMGLVFQHIESSKPVVQAPVPAMTSGFSPELISEIVGAVVSESVKAVLTRLAVPGTTI